ncbi:MAG: hypothetical protein AAGB24_07595 [Bacteroidota bacterium]
MKPLLFVISFFIVQCFAFTQSQQDSIVVTEDSNSVITARKITDDLDQIYSGDSFNYDIKTGESQNLLARFLTWLGNGLNEVLGINISPETFLILSYIIYGLMGLLIIYLLIRILINEKFNALFTKKARTINDIDLTEQHIDHVNLEGLLMKALNEKAYRTAIRYHFLMVLQKLSLNEYIDWHFEKTNTEYESEIEGGRLKKAFNEAAYLYDYIWYGKRPIDEIKYNAALQKFTDLNTLITL